jgi:hypothetical protein
MSKLLALLAILLILTGVVLLAVPKEEVASTRSLSPDAIPVPTIVSQVRGVAELVSAPLSIICGFVSLFYSRRTYLVNKERADRDRAGHSA